MKVFMEADDILINISEIESPNYNNVELDLLNLPRDLSTNLNEDSDNQKENVVPNKRFRMVEYTQEDSSHNTVKVFGDICPGTLSSPIEMKKSVITFMLLFRFCLCLRYFCHSK
jgi:hypothetical protein